MHVSSLPTPAILVDINVMEQNILRVSKACKQHDKLLFPMTKTHKCSEIARMQADAGIDGFLCGTLEEAEAFSEIVPRIMLPYPILNPANLSRIAPMMKRVQVILALDGIDAANAYQTFLGENAVDYLLIVNVGLGRLGVQPKNAAALAAQIAAQCPSLRFCGIATHPGHVYRCKTNAEIRTLVENVEADYSGIIAQLAQQGMACDIVATGSTPTFEFELTSSVFSVLRPGNYVFNDLDQVKLGVAAKEDCALTVLATIIAQPSDDQFIMDCGSKCLSLDEGAHSSGSNKGFGYVIDHDEITVESLSEEIGKLRIKGNTNLKPGDKIRIIPNHSCPVANQTSYLVGIRKDTVERLLHVDVRNNNKPPYKQYSGRGEALET